MKSFLEEVSEDILNKIGVEKLKDSIVVLPSRRAGLHFKKSISGLIDKPVLLPEITTINNFIFGFSSLQTIVGFKAELELYNSYKKITDNPESLEVFLNLAPLILSDFNLIDKHLLEGSKLLFDLQSINEIENWSLNETNLTVNQEKLVAFWKNLGNLYDEYNKSLEIKGLATEGQIYRSVSKKIHDSNINSHVFFIGLNALSKAEEKIITFLMKNEKADFYFDGDKYYTKNTNFEAGFFYRKFDFFANNNLPDNFLNNPKNINIYEARTDIDQVNIAASILQKENLNINSTALYLIDENLLSPLIQKIPNNINDLNITMGLPIQNTYAFGFLNQILKTLDNRSDKEFWKGNRINHQFLLDTFCHPFCSNIFPEGFINSNFWKNIVRKNLKYIDLDSFINQFPKSSKLLSFANLKNKHNTQEFIAGLLDYIQEISNFIDDKIESEAIKLLINEVKKLQEYILNYSENINNSIIIRVIHEKWSQLHLPFYGEPLSGLQIMGFLESRSLDYENIILLSCNESNLPASEYDPSLIPSDVKKHYKIPGIFETDAMFGYYFYRSIQRSKNIHLIYSSQQKNKIGSTEQSRFIQQIEKELNIEKNITINRIKVTFKKNTIALKNEITNDPLTKSKIIEFLKKGLSPSAINCFLSCPQDFYYKYILKLQEEPIIEDTIEGNTLGTILHSTLKNLYSNQKKVTPKIIDDLIVKFPEVLENEFNSTFPDKRYKNGENALYYRQAYKCIDTFLKNEKTNIIRHGEFEILEIEKKLFHEISIEHNNKTHLIKLKGTIDRVDLTKKGIRIIDYKSGFSKQNDVIFKNFNAFKTRPHALQLMTYSYLYYLNSDKQPIKAALISLKNPRANIITLKYNNLYELNNDVFLEFENYIKTFILALLDDDQKFEHEISSKYCMICE